MKQKRHCRSARCRQSQHHVHRSQSLRRRHTRTTLKITHYECFSSSSPQVRNALKPPHNWIVSIDGQPPRWRKSPRLCVMPFSRSAQGWAKHLRRLLHSRPRLPSRGCRNRAITCSWKSMWTRQTAISAAPKYTKSRLTHGKESQCARRLNDWTARKGGLGGMG